MKLLRILLIGAFVFLFLSSALANTTDPVIQSEGLQKKLAVRGQNLILERKSGEAMDVCRKILGQFPRSPLGYFGMMSIYQGLNFENYDFRYQNDYQGWAEKGRKRAINVLENRDSTSWELLITGGTLGLSGLTKIREGKWWSGLRDGMMAVNSLEKAVRKDPDFADPYVGLGIYEYWRSVFTQKFWWLPFFSDQREEGIKKIKYAVEKGEFVEDVGKISLAFIYYNEKKYDAAAEILKKYVDEVPNNIVIRTIYGQNLTALKKYEESEENFEEILKIDPKIHMAHLFLGIALAEEGKDPDRAENELNLFLTFDSSEKWKKLARETLTRAEISHFQPCLKETRYANLRADGNYDCSKQRSHQEKA